MSDGGDELRSKAPREPLEVLVIEVPAHPLVELVDSVAKGMANGVRVRQLSSSAA